MTPLKKYIWLVDTVMRAGDKGLTLEQIGDRWDADDEMHDNGAFARRTFHRHRNEIEDLFGIKIECYGDGSDYRYRIADDVKNVFFRRWMMDAIAVNRIVMDSREVSRYVELESYNDEALPILMQALKEQRMVSFTYSPYWKDEPSQYYNFKPYNLKMFERRWYLIGYYGSEKEHRIYALDRITNCELQEDTFRRNPKFSFEKMFDGVYGIIVKDELPVESVWLKVDAYQANYLRSLPLHHSQNEIKRNNEYSVFALRVRPTYDFKQKILSLGSTVEVLKPTSLRDDIKGEVTEILKKYIDEDA
ncbi:MAG: WYL domain-containing protein [Bacteroidales bacterium]|nr:WYL domain-containing protein [Bacteroidales bacterium]